jgi:hypothetical protein
MAVKSSGQLSLRYDILPEIGGSYVNLSLRSLSSRAGFSTPDAMSEFYGFSNNAYFISATGGGFLKSNTVSPPPTGGDRQFYSMGLWIRNNAPTRRSQNLMAIGDVAWDGRQFVGTGDYFLLRYLGNLNRIIVEVAQGYTRRLKRDYPLHDNPNRAITNVANSSTGWRAAQRGFTNPQGFSFLSCTVDLNQTTATNAIKFYWNGQECTYSVSNNNSPVFPASRINAPYVAVGDSLHQVNPSVGAWYGDIDNAFFYPGLLGEGVMQAIWSGGNVSPRSYFTNNALNPLAVWGFENNTFRDDPSIHEYRLTSGGTTSFGTY